MIWKDTPAGYGLVSILSHWISALVIIGLLISGNSLASAEAGDLAWQRQVHTGIALSAYLVLVFRVVWRVYQGHPGALARQNGRLVRVAKLAHFTLLGLIGVMLVSGPLTAGFGGIAISWFGQAAMPVPFVEDSSGYWLFHEIHRISALLITFLILIHIAGALLHLALFKDRTLDKILLPGVDRTPKQ